MITDGRYSDLNETTLETTVVATNLAFSLVSYGLKLLEQICT
jgi:hypothetical protein